MAMTEEQKKINAERMAAARAAKAKERQDEAANVTETVESDSAAQEIVESGESESDLNFEKMAEATGERLYSEEEVQAMAAEAARKAVAEALANQQPVRIYTSQNDEIVSVLFIAEVSERSVLSIPGYGSMTPGSTLDVPKKEFGGQFMSPLVRQLLNKREMLVLSGLNEDERIRWGVDYKDGEVMDARTFDRMLDFDTDKISMIFKKLCVEHQHFVATRFITAKERGDNRVSIEKVQALNEISKMSDSDGMFKPVLEAYGKQVAES